MLGKIDGLHHFSRRMLLTAGAPFIFIYISKDIDASCDTHPTRCKTVLTSLLSTQITSRCFIATGFLNPPLISLRDEVILNTPVISNEH